jgi:hypothetical protein
VTLSATKLRAVVNLLADPLQAHAAANILATEAKARGVVVADLIASSAIAPSPPPPSQPIGSYVRRIDGEHIGVVSRLIHETPKAWLVSKPSDGEPIWLPKSQCQRHGEDHQGRLIIVVPTWLALRNGITRGG